MTPQPQPTPPQQPIYADQLALALDRQYTRITDYSDHRIEKLIVLLRIYQQEARTFQQESLQRDQESLQRDVDLLRRVEALETGQKFIVDTLLQMQQTMSEMRQEMRDGFAA